MVSEMKQKYVKSTISEEGKPPNLVPDGGDLLYAVLGVTANNALDTIGQVDQNDPSSQDKALKKALSKAISLTLNGRLLTLEDTPMRSRYHSAMDCMKYVFQNGQVLWSRLCGQRTCLICSKLHTSKMLRSYTPEFDKMVDPQFVVLTYGRLPHVSEIGYEGLQFTFEALRKDLTNVIRRCKRKLGRQVNAIGTFECAIDPYKQNPFHPHFNLIVDGYESAKMIKQEWIKEHNVGGQENISPDAQYIRSADKGSLKELFKYVTKMLGKNDFDAVCYDAVQRAIANKRTVFTFGSIRAHRIKSSNEEMFVADWLPNQTEVFKYTPKVFDWTDPKRNRLTGFNPNQDEIDLIKSLKYKK